jgi:OFA family oxalate/formate antiporter-like MFS transporter
LKWFPDRRGFAAGLTAMGFGAGSALTVIPIAAMIRSAGYDAAFLRVGIAQGAVILAFAWWLAAPPEGVAAVGAARAAGAAGAASGPRATGVERHYRPLEMARTPVFWVLYLMFVMMATGGLMVTAQLAPIAHDLRIADIPVSLLGITLPALTFALSIDRILNGITRPFFGWVSDWLGREHTMFAAFALEAAGILLLSRYGHNPVAFVLLSGLVFFAWGEIYSLFPATCGDTFGRRFASANAGLLYTAKGTAALLVPLSSLAAAAGGWKTVFAVAASLDATAAVLALVLLKPLRRSLGRAAAVRPPAHALDAPA